MNKIIGLRTLCSIFEQKGHLNRWDWKVGKYKIQINLKHQKACIKTNSEKNDNKTKHKVLFTKIFSVNFFWSHFYSVGRKWKSFHTIMHTHLGQDQEQLPIYVLLPILTHLLKTSYFFAHFRSKGYFFTRPSSICAIFLAGIEFWIFLFFRVIL